MSIQALREQRQALAKESRNFMDQKGSATWTKDDQAKADSFIDQITALDEQIESMQKLIDAEAGQHFERDPADDPKDKSKKARNEAYKKLLRHGANALSSDEHALIRNTMSTTTGNQGGYTVQTDIASTMIDTLKGYKGMRDVADSISTGDGRPLSYPTSDGTSETGEICAENAPAAAADPVFGTVALNTVKFGSKIIAIPIELLMDSNIDIVAMINKRVRDRIGRIQNTKFTIGAGYGSGEPNGLVTAASVGKTGTTGQTLTVIYDDLVDVIDSVDYAYDNGNLKWMFSQSVRKVVRKIKDTAGRPIWTPNYDSGIQGGFVDNLLGYDVQINNDMPVPAANAKSMAFGDFSKYMIRDALEFTLFRFEDSAYVSKGQIGFLAWARAGGNLLDPAAVKLYQHSAT